MSLRPEWLHRLLTMDKAVQTGVEVEEKGTQTESWDHVRVRGSSLKHQSTQCMEHEVAVPFECVEKLVELPSYKAWRWR